MKNIRIAYYLLGAILLVGILVRVYQYPDNPPGLNQDEASIAYDAYAVANYGVDRNGDAFPIHFLGWGNGQSALYGYLIMPFIKLFGFSPATTRIGNLLAGILAIFFVFSLIKITGKIEFALIGAVLTAVCPWGIMVSRWGPEASILPFVLLVAVYLYALAYKNPVFLPISLIVFAATFYCYSTSYFFTPVFLLFLIYYAKHFFTGKKGYFKYMGLSLGLFILASLPIGLFVLINIILKNAHAFRFLGITITKLVQTGVRYQMFLLLSDWRHNIPGTLDLLARNFQYYVGTVFLQEGNFLNVLGQFGNFYYFSTFFLLTGMFAAVFDWISAAKKKQFCLDSIIIVWFLVASLLGILMETNPFRINVIFYTLYYFIAKGIYTTGQLIYTGLKLAFRSELVSRINKFAFYIILGGFYLAGFFSFLNVYFRDYPGMTGVWFRDSFREAYLYAESIRGEHENLYIADYDTGTIYVYVLYYGKIDPRYFKKNVIYTDPFSEWRPVSEFGPYKFLDNQEKLRNPEKNAVYLVYRDYTASMPYCNNTKVFKNYSIYKY
ncbi:MAG: glycosyltransferase family 39 protein [Bacillota bacterium]